MRASRRDMRDVVLVEDDDAVPAAEGRWGSPRSPSGGSATGTSPTGSAPDSSAPDSSPTDGPARARAGLAWLWGARSAWAPIAVGLAIVVATNGLVTAQQERDRMGALAGVPGVLRPLDGPVRELWRTSDVYLSGLVDFRGLLLVAENRMDGTTDVVALEPRTGAAVWQVAARGTDPEPGTSGDGASSSGSGSGAGASCAFPDPGTGSTASVVACVVTDETASVTIDARGELTYPTRTHLLVLDATTGAVVSQAPAEPTAKVAQLGSDLVLGWTDADGFAHVTRSDPRDAALRWTFTSPHPVDKDEFGQRNLSVGTTEGFVVVSAVGAVSVDDGRILGGSSWVLSDDGTVVLNRETDPTNGFSGVGVLPGGSTFTEMTMTPAGTTATVLTDAVTGRAVTVEAYPTIARPDDGSLPGTLLMQSTTDNAMFAYDPAAGRTRWSGPGSESYGGSILVVDGRVVRTAGTELTSVDGRSGRTLWSAKLSSSQMGSLVTDGRLALVPQAGSGPGAGTRATITAFSLDDGRQRWEVATSEELWLIEAGGTLFGLSGSDLVAFG